MAVLAFTSSPDILLDALDERWNPEYLLLFSLNSTVNSTGLLMDERVQRSRHIALLEADTPILDQSKGVLEQDTQLLEKDTELLTQDIMFLGRNTELLKQDLRSKGFKESVHRGRFRVFTSQPFTPYGKGWGEKLPLGVWREDRFNNFSVLFPERFPTLGGRMLYLGSWCDDFPFLYPGDEEGSCLGCSLDLLDMLAGYLNFTYHVQQEPEVFMIYRIWVY